MSNQEEHMGECRSCNHIGLMKTYPWRTYSHGNPFNTTDVDLCAICACTFAGNAAQYPEHYPQRDTMALVARLTNALVDALGVRESFEESLRRDLDE